MHMAISGGLNFADTQTRTTLVRHRRSCFHPLLGACKEVEVVDRANAPTRSTAPTAARRTQRDIQRYVKCLMHNPYPVHKTETPQKGARVDDG